MWKIVVEPYRNPLLSCVTKVRVASRLWHSTVRRSLRRMKEGAYLAKKVQKAWCRTRGKGPMTDWKGPMTSRKGYTTEGKDSQTNWKGPEAEWKALRPVKKAPMTGWMSPTTAGDGSATAGKGSGISGKGPKTGGKGLWLIERALDMWKGWPSWLLALEPSCFQLHPCLVLYPPQLFPVQVCKLRISSSQPVKRALQLL